MRKDFPALFHDVILCPQNTRDGVVLSREGCNVPNFEPNNYRHVPLDYDDYLDVLFLYWVEDPTTYEHDDFFLYIGRKPIIDDICICLFVLGVDLEAHD